jgi:hypothetical protein
VVRREPRNAEKDKGRRCASRCLNSPVDLNTPWQNYLEFSLRLQEYIELCRKKQQTDALAYAQKYLSTWQETHMREIEQAMSLLFFGQGTNVGIYKVSLSSRM